MVVVVVAVVLVVVVWLVLLCPADGCPGLSLCLSYTHMFYIPYQPSPSPPLPPGKGFHFADRWIGHPTDLPGKILDGFSPRWASERNFLGK